MPVAINNEQLEAEMDAGLHEQLGIVVSRTTLAHLVLVSQFALTTGMHSGSAELLRVFIRDAVRIGGFPPQLTLLIEQRSQTT
jgi:hypothetical protein